MAHSFNIQSFILIKYQLSNNCHTVLAKDINHVSFSCFNYHTEILLGLNLIKLPIMAITQVQPNTYQWHSNNISRALSSQHKQNLDLFIYIVLTKKLSRVNSLLYDIRVLCTYTYLTLLTLHCNYLPCWCLLNNTLPKLQP